MSGKTIDDCVNYLISLGYSIKEETSKEENKDSPNSKNYMKNRFNYNAILTRWFKNISNKCIIKNVFKNIKKFVSSSASSSSIFLAEYKGKIPELVKYNTINKSNELAVKVCYTSDKRFDNGMDIERQIYEHIIPKLIHHTPFILYSYSSYKCKDTKFNKKIQDLYKETKIDRNGKVYSINPQQNDVSNFLVLEKTSGNTFYKIFSKLFNENKEEELTNMLIAVSFQVLWTLKCFSLVNMRHNDLHQNNIFVEILPEDISMNFKLNNGKVVRLNTKYLVKIYDFDRASVSGNENIDRNMFIDYNHCLNHNECNYNDNKVDLWKFLSDIYGTLDEYYGETDFITYYLSKIIYDSDYKPIPLKPIPYNILEHIDVCIDELLKYSKDSTILFYEDKKNSYTLPQKVLINKFLDLVYNEKKEYTPINNVIESKESEEFDFITVIENTLYNMLIQWNNELLYFYNYNWEDQSNVLYDDILTKTKDNIQNMNFYKAIVLMACPMFHKLREMDNKASEDEKGYVDELLYYMTEKNSEITIIKYYIHYIWKLYNNNIKLFKVPLV